MRLLRVGAMLLLAGCAGGTAMPSAAGPAPDVAAGATAVAAPRSTAVATAFPLGEQPSAATSAAPREPPPSVDSTAPPVEPDATPAFPDTHDDPALEALLAVEVDGTRLTTASLSGPSAAAGAGYLTPLLAALERTEDDLTTALARDPSSVTELVAFAIRIRDVDPADLQAAFLATVGYTDASEVTIAGKAVRTIPTDWSSYVYATGDTLFVVQSPHLTLAEAVLGALP